MKIGGDRRSGSIEDRRGQGPAMAGAGGGLAMLAVRLLLSRAGRRFILPVALVLVAGFVLFPKQTQAVIGALVGGGGTAPAQRLPSEEEQRLAEFTDGVLATTQEVWAGEFAKKGQSYAKPTLVLFTGATSTACGFGQAAMGPFYCPPDSKVYLDLAFFREMEVKLGAKGDFAKAYVIAHEVGHHIQNLDGTLSWAAGAKRAAGSEVGANQVQVRVELMADCLAGVWAHGAGRLEGVELERGDLEEAILAAQAVGDDTLQRRSSGRVAPDAFTHGSAEQRMRWFRRGWDTGDPAACNTRSMAYERL